MHAPKKSCAIAGRRCLQIERLLIIERELPKVGQHAADVEPFLLDLVMLVMSPGGRERTRQEFASLLSAARFELTRVVTTDGPVSIFEARPAQIPRSARF